VDADGNIALHAFADMPVILCEPVVGGPIGGGIDASGFQRMMLVLLL
jgi:hypothetical protein